MPATPPVSSTPVHAVPIQASSNPYASASAAAAAEQEGSGPRERVGRAFRFNQKGKYSALGDQLRKDAQLEELKKRIAENARKAGLDSEFDTAEKNIKVGLMHLDVTT
jgi:U4/U6 small nuclear ribonucleoprotein PRP3